MMTQETATQITKCWLTEELQRNNVKLIEEFVAACEAFLQNYYLFCEGAEDEDFDKMGELIHKLHMNFRAPSEQLFDEF